jgi:hypothetical protein
MSFVLRCSFVTKLQIFVALRSLGLNHALHSPLKFDRLTVKTAVGQCLRWSVASLEVTWRSRRCSKSCRPSWCDNTLRPVHSALSNGAPRPTLIGCGSR